MTLWIQAKGISKEWNGKTLFQGVDLELRAGERAALFGRNGSGKTTLLTGLRGGIEFDSGSVYRGCPVADWGLMEQHDEEDVGELSLIDFVRMGDPSRYEIWRRMTEGAAVMAATDGAAGLDDYAEAAEAYAAMDGYGWELEVDQALSRLGLGGLEGGQTYGSLSGGQKTRAKLARLMAGRPQLLMLDEPTNHLDEESLVFLEQWLAAFPGAVLFVSHDRAFIDHVATQVLELREDGLGVYPGGYTAYREAKETERRTMEAKVRKEKQERQKLMESIRRYQQWFDAAHKAAGQNDFLRSKSKKNVSRLHAKESALERLEQGAAHAPVDKPRLKMMLEDDGFEAARFMRLEEVGFAYGSAKPLLSRFSLTISRGDRIAILGPSGSGKSTLLKLLSGELNPCEGRRSSHPKMKIGYFSQELDRLPNEAALLDMMLGLPDMTQSEARTLLGAFLFSREDVHKRIGDLSMGERCRAAFLRLMLGGSNLLLLDEPTNYLDIESREVVEASLRSYDGAMVLATHDRALLKSSVNRLLVFEEGGKGNPLQYPGSYEDYLESKAERQRDNGGRSDGQRLAGLELAVLMSAPEPEEEEERQAFRRRLMELRRRAGL
ncbi:hypothetical protein VE23_01970 [Paenibacillus sp. D9]|uniref:ribosomal protection-like ABC-F family protein n=1 Tax=Paenibacillus sp. D9 TaxID=665792 RepID=UPI00061E1DC4|nr:ABC-F family ATP-binding cassette domain-containing protein [Paenibacillus sp. D9]KKC46146.1 hypothetical protein VE23_01970 [Paenibacillus sp. D9]